MHAGDGICVALQRTNHHKSLAWGREVQVGKLQLQDHLIFTAQARKDFSIVSLVPWYP